MSTPLSDEQLSAIKDALFQGRKIEAIKLYREATHVGLAEAKNAVEKLELRKVSPGKFSTTPSGKGCLGVLVVMCATTVLLVLVLMMQHR
jgi:hypothetical protein